MASLLERTKNIEPITVKIKELWFTDRALRAAKRDHKQWPDFCKSIAKFGIMQDPLANSNPEALNGMPEGKLYGVVDGCQRLHAWMEHLKTTFLNANPKLTSEELDQFVGEESVTVKIGSFTLNEERDLMLILNIQRIQTSRKELAEHLQRMLSEHNCTQTELAEMVDMNQNEISVTLRFNKLSKNIQDNYLPTAPVLMMTQLAKLPHEYQDEIVSDPDFFSLPPEKQNGIIQGSIKQWTKDKKIAKGVYHPPSPKFIGNKKLRERMEAVEAAGQMDVLEGMLIAIGQDKLTLENDRIQWEADQLAKKNKTVESVEEQIRKLQEEKAKLEAAKK